MAHFSSSGVTFFVDPLLGSPAKGALSEKKSAHNKSQKRILNRTLYNKSQTQLKSDWFKTMQQTRGFQRLTFVTPFEYSCANLN
jgi:hypothetical protein